MSSKQMLSLAQQKKAIVMAANTNASVVTPILVSAVLGLLALLPFSERSLIPIPSVIERGLIAQQVSDEGPESILNNVLADAGARTAPSALSGARRLISRQVSRIGTPIGGDSQFGGQASGVGGDTNASLADQIGAAPTLLAGLGDGLTGQGTISNSGGNQGPNAIAGPAGPGFGSGGATNLASSTEEVPLPVPDVSAPVPEASTWLLMICGLILVAAVLRSGSPGGASQIKKFLQV